ncbi:hypothetical protein RRG08_037327 [Elysia crispata]|uniref:Uncharacterized protein n=1 Tax=Elysia crispata TaxID=231223 RepID=A0AAE1DYJ7_9GAST|nr:hypothetical protein RRG08_037327 [Elysia crispata]
MVLYTPGYGTLYAWRIWYSIRLVNMAVMYTCRPSSCLPRVHHLSQPVATPGPTATPRSTAPVRCSGFPRKGHAQMGSVGEAFSSKLYTLKHGIWNGRSLALERDEGEQAPFLADFTKMRFTGRSTQDVHGFYRHVDLSLNNSRRPRILQACRLETEQLKTSTDLQACRLETEQLKTSKDLTSMST